jgi:hypothetical protein
MSSFVNTALDIYPGSLPCCPARVEGAFALERMGAGGGDCVPSLDKLPSVIDTLIAAVRNGELDEQWPQASTQALQK